jgi:hypothetical protein
MMYDLQKNYAKITNKNKSLYMRSYRLYQFCVAVYLSTGTFYGLGFGIRSDFIVSRRLMRTARVVAASRLMNAIKKDTEESGVSSKSLRSKLNQNADYRFLMDAFLRNDGWRRMIDVSWFNDELLRARLEGQQIAKMIDFSLRYKTHANTEARTGGVGAALEFAPYINDLHLNTNSTDLGFCWRAIGHSGIWFWINTVYKYRMRPPAVNSSNFKEILFERLELEYFEAAVAAYNAIYPLLSSQGYKERLQQLPSQLSAATAAPFFPELPQNWFVEIEEMRLSREQVRTARCALPLETFDTEEDEAAEGSST